MLSLAAVRTASTSGYWTNATTWDTIPGVDDDAVINNAVTVTLDTATASLNSFTNNGTLIFNGWSNAVMTSTWVQINGTVTHTTNTDQTGTPGVYADWAPDSRVWIVCSNLTVAAAGRIDANGKGYVAGTPSGGNIVGRGPGGGAVSDHGGGGGHGGLGGYASNGALWGGPTYGSEVAPTDPGSSGGSAYDYTAGAKGGNGGGVVRIDATGLVTINGVLTANGDVGGPNGYTSGGGAGGSIYITCSAFAGSGTIRAAGGNGQSWSGVLTGAGGGGRVAVVYSPTAQDALPLPSTTWDVAGGRGGAPATYSEPGSLYLTDTRFLSSTNLITNSFALVFRDPTNWVGNDLTITNAWVKFPTNFAVAFTNTLMISGTNTKVEFLAPTLLHCQNLIVASNGLLYLNAGPTNATWPTYGGLVTVDGLIQIGTNSFIYPYSHASNGGSLKFVVGAINVAAGGAIDAAGKGYRGYYTGAPNIYKGYGPGGGSTSDRSGGGGYGGGGGRSRNNDPGGGTYGSSNAPVDPGSCGGNGSGYNGTMGLGGGVIWVDALSEIRVDGALSANGGNGLSYGGGGAGGSIYITAETLSGSGQLLAKGGTGGPGGGSDGGGGGGGGRIAVWSSFSADWLGTCSVTNGTQAYTNWAYATNGTLVLQYIVPSRPGISNLSPSSIQVASTTLNGDLFTTGRSDTAAAVFWGPQDQTTNTSLWVSTNTFAGPLPAGVLTTNVGITGDPQMYYYRYRAVNSGGQSWAGSTEWFLAGEVNFRTLAPIADEFGLKPATVVVERASSATNGNLTVYYTVGGGAANGVDYQTLSSNVVLAAGESNTTIVIQPLWDFISEGDETVTLNLAAGRYVIGSSNAVALTLLDKYIAPGLNTTLSSGAWTDVNTWSLLRPPYIGDAVVIANPITVDVTVPGLISLTVNPGQTLTFYGSNTCITADTVTVQGTLTHATNTATAAPWTPDAKVYIVCSNFNLDAGGIVNLDGRGYFGPTNSAGYGPGAGAKTDWGGGAGHGGYGGVAWNGTLGGGTYGSIEAPVWPGSSGGAAHPYTVKSGSGGGALRIQASGEVRIDSTVTANGEDAPGPDGNNTCGGGAGGSIYITCRTLAGNGAFSARGGFGNVYNAPNRAGAGGGGRIAIVYDTAAQGASPTPTMTFVLRGGRGGVSPCPFTQPGSLYLSDASFYDPSLITNSMTLVISNRTTWAPASLEVSNAWLRTAPGLDIRVTNAATIQGADAVLELLAPARFSAASLLLTNGAAAWFRAGPTNGGIPAYGGLVSVPGVLRICTNCALYPVCDATNGAAVWFNVGDLTLDAGGTLNASGYGFQGFRAGNVGMGPGGGNATDLGAGGGYGGVGSTDFRGNAGGPTYGSSNAPTLAGSAGGRASGNAVGGGAGGGVVWVNAARYVTVNGVISANGAALEGNSGGGSGGSIYVYAPRFQGTGRLEANGANGPGVNWAGGGGGGRIAIWRFNWTDFMTTSVTGGVGCLSIGGPGTVVWGQRPLPGTVFVVH